MNKKQISSGEERIIRTFLKFNEKQLNELLENDGDITLIKKKKRNIKLYEQQLEELNN